MTPINQLILGEQEMIIYRNLEKELERTSWYSRLARDCGELEVSKNYQERARALYKSISLFRED